MVERFEEKNDRLENDFLKNRRYRHSGLNWTTLLWVLLAWFIFAAVFRGLSPAPQSAEISYTKFKQHVRNGKVAEITIDGNRIGGKFRESEKDRATGGESQNDQTEGAEKDGGSIFSFFRGEDGGSRLRYFRTIKPAIQDSELLPLLESHNVIIKAESQETSWLWTLMVSLLPWVLIFGLFYFAGRITDVT